MVVVGTLKKKEVVCGMFDVRIVVDCYAPPSCRLVVLGPVASKDDEIRGDEYMVRNM